MRKTIRPIYEEYKQLGIDQQIDYAKFYLYSIITHSTAIEGSTVTELENRLLFDEGIGSQKPLIEQMMNLDLKTAYEQGMIYARQHTDYSVNMLCGLSAGIGGRSYIAYQKVPSRTEAFCQWLNEERRHIDPKEIEKVYDLSFEAHYRLSPLTTHLSPLTSHLSMSLASYHRLLRKRSASNTSPRWNRAKKKIVRTDSKPLCSTTIARTLSSR